MAFVTVLIPDSSIYSKEELEKEGYGDFLILFGNKNNLAVSEVIFIILFSF